MRYLTVSGHKATICWNRTSPDFLKGRYSREHTWAFDGGVTVLASPSPSVVPAPFSNAANVDPEEAFVAAVSSCHMLTYLYLACQQGFQVDRYHDEAVGVMTKNEKGIPWVSVVTLHPKIATAVRSCRRLRTSSNSITRRTSSATSPIPSRPKFELQGRSMTIETSAYPLVVSV